MRAEGSGIKGVPQFCQASPAMATSRLRVGPDDRFAGAEEPSEFIDEFELTNLTILNELSWCGNAYAAKPAASRPHLWRAAPSSIFGPYANQAALLPLPSSGMAGVGAVFFCRRSAPEKAGGY